MNRRTRTMLSVLAVAALAALPNLASEEVAKKVGARCTACHDKKGSRLLTHKGKYFEHKRTLAGYDQILRKFKKCTLCHVSEPGSMGLTRTGEELKLREVTMDHLSAPDPSQEKAKRKK